MGGSDQWGNITAGIDLIRRLRRQKVHGLVVPLVTSASGHKFGKTEAGTIWLDPARTSPFRFYQFWLNADDRDVISYLRYFTFLERERIEEYEIQVRSAPEERAAQRALARIVTTQVHGMEEAGRAEQASRVLFGEDIRTLKVEDVLAVFDDVPSTSVLSVDVGAGVSVVDLFTQVGLASSKSEAKRLAQSGGLYVNNRRISDTQARLTIDDAIEGRLFLLRKGAKQNHLVRLT
jgi:tyrosyl-tRNA synthetase